MDAPPSDLIADLNREMGEKRRELAGLMREIEEESEVLSRARARHAKLAEALQEMTAATERKRFRLFALMLQLEGKQKARAYFKEHWGEAPAVSDPGAEQRIYVRRSFPLHINFGGLGGFYSGFASNISEGGIAVATSTPLPVGKRFAVEFSLSEGGLPIRCPVEVMWAHHDSVGSLAELGLRFSALLPTDRASLISFTRGQLVTEP